MPGMKRRSAQPYPELNAAAESVASALAPLVEALAEFGKFNGAILFVPDGHHTGTAGAATVVHAPGRSARQLEFARRHIQGHRVDLRASTLGDMFREPGSSYLPSRLNPRSHQVFGLSIGPASRPHAIVQLAFDVRAPGELPSIERIRDVHADHTPVVHAATGELLRAGKELRSISDALLLSTPTTPNAYVIMWDVVESTALARLDYGWLRHYLNTFGGQVAQLVEAAGGNIAGHRGDGQNIVLPLPADFDRADHAALEQFVATQALPLVHQIEAAHAAIGAPMGIKIRLTHGLAHVESSYLGEATGEAFFRLAQALKSTPLG